MVKPRSRSTSKNDKNKNKSIKTKEASISIDADINDSEWKCIVVMAMESDISNSDFISFFQEEAKKNIRPVIKGLTFEVLLQSVKKEKGNKNKGKSRDTSKGSSKKSTPSKKPGSSKGSQKSGSVKPQQVPKTEDIVELVLSGVKKGQVPPEPLAKLIKKYILNLKQCDIEEKKMLELLKNIDQNSPTRKSDKQKKTDKIKPPKDKKGKKNEKAKKDAKVESPGKKNKQKKEKEKTGINKSPKKALQINDHPALGPNMYIVLSGFYDPNLLIEMTKIGIPIKSIVAIDSQPEETAELITDDETVLLIDDKTTVHTKKKDKKSDQSKKIEKLVQFWGEISNVLNNPENKEASKDLPMIRCTPSINFKTNEQKKDKLSAAYNEMSFIMYKIYDYWRKYELYINNMTIVKVECEQVLSLENASLYNSTIGLVPLECCTIEIVLHCMLEQICWTVQAENEKRLIEGKCETSQQSNLALLSFSSKKSNTPLEEVDDKGLAGGDSILQSSIRGNDPSIKSITRDSSVQGQTSADLYFENVNNVTPMLIESYDIVKALTFHLNIPGVNIDEISSNMFLKSPIFALWNRYPIPSEYKQKLYNYHLQNFQRCCDDFYFGSNYLFKIYLHQMILQRMMSVHFNLITNYQFESDNLYFNEEICNILLNCGEVMDELMPKKEESVDVLSPLIDTDVEIAEKLDEVVEGNSEKEEGSLNQSSNKIRLSNVFLTLSEKHNLREKDMIYLKSFLECKDLRNLFEDIDGLGILKSSAVNDEIKQLLFIKEMDTKMLTQTLYESFRNFPDVSYSYFSPTDCIILWFYQNHDLKYINYERSEFKLNTLVGFKDFYDLILFKEEKLLQDIENNNKKINQINMDVKINYTNNNHTDAEQTDIIVNESLTKNITPLPKDVELENGTDLKLNKSYCYNLGPSQISFKESLIDFYSPLGTHVQLKKTKHLKESPILGVKIDCFNNILSFDQHLPITELESKLYFKTYNDIIISADIKLFYNTSKSSDESKPDVDISKSAKSPTKVPDLTKDVAETDSGLRIVLPTGLQIEIVKTESDVGPFYVRQKYLYKNMTCSKILDEDYRCYLKNGCILIFKLDETVDVLYSNSTIVKCTNFKYVVPIVEPEPEPEKEIETNTLKDSPKKGKRSSSKSKSKRSTQKPVSKKENKKDKAISKKTTVKDKDLKSPKRKKKGKSVILEEIPIQPPSPVLMMDKYIISALGECLQTENDVIQSNDMFFTLRTAYDPDNFEFYTYRSDGTNCLHHNDSLIVNFPDGTRIETSCEEDINVEIDIQNFDYTEIGKVKEFISNAYKKFNMIENHSSETATYVMLNCETIEERGSMNFKESSLIEEESKEALNNISENGYKTENDIENIIIEPKEEDNVEEDMDESFDILTMDCNLGHENYATVNYKNRSKQIIIQLPGKVTVIIHGDQRVEVTIDTNTDLMINKYEASLVSTASEFPSLDCMTIINFPKNEAKPEFEEDQNLNSSLEFLCQTIDVNGNVFLIDNSGETKTFQSKSIDLSSCLNEFNLEIKENACKDRYFVLRRDLSGYEIINKNHPTISKVLDDSRSVSKYPVLKNTNFYKYIKQKPVLQTRSEKYIMKQNKVLPVQLKRKHLSKPRIYKQLWFPDEMNELQKEKSYIYTIQNSITSKNKAFTIQSVQQIKNEQINIETYFNEALRKYISNCTDKYNEYEKHIVKETRTEEEVLENAKLILNVLEMSNHSLKCDLRCSLCKVALRQMSSFSENQSFCSKSSLMNNDSEKFIKLTDFDNLSFCDVIE